MKDLFSLAKFNRRIIFSDHFQLEELALRSISTCQTSSLTPISTRRISSMINFQTQNSLTIFSRSLHSDQFQHMTISRAHLLSTSKAEAIEDTTYFFARRLAFSCCVSSFLGVGGLSLRGESVSDSEWPRSRFLVCLGQYACWTTPAF